MADLEKNLEQAIEEALQPDSKAVKGDSKPVKQGSSDAEKIESGKGEVVKPEENPVDKAVASVKSAEKGTKEVSGDAQQKGESAPEKQPKLKKVSEAEDSEDEKPGKMKRIKAMVNAMKDMDKEKLQAMYSEMSDKKKDDEEEEIDESLTKAEIARNIVELMKKKDEDEVEEGYSKFFVEEEEKEDEEEELKKSLGELPDAARAAVEALWKSNRELVEKSQKLESELGQELAKRERGEFIAKSEKSLCNVPGHSLEEVCDLVLEAKARDEDFGARIEKALTAASNGMKGGATLVEAGSNAPVEAPGDAWERIQQLANEEVKKSGGSMASAIAQTIQTNPAPYAEYSAKRNS